MFFFFKLLVAFFPSVKKCWLFQLALRMGIESSLLFITDKSMAWTQMKKKKLLSTRQNESTSLFIHLIYLFFYLLFAYLTLNLIHWNGYYCLSSYYCCFQWLVQRDFVPTFPKHHDHLYNRVSHLHAAQIHHLQTKCNTNNLIWICLLIKQRTCGQLDHVPGTNCLAQAVHRKQSIW